MGETRPNRVMTVDHKILRGGSRFSLLAFDDLELVGEARSGEEALRLCSELRPDVVLMDMAMPGMDGAEMTQALLARLPQVQVLPPSSYHDPDVVQRAMQADAIGHLAKRDLCQPSLHGGPRRWPGPVARLRPTTNQSIPVIRSKPGFECTLWPSQRDSMKTTQRTGVLAVRPRYNTDVRTSMRTQKSGWCTTPWRA
jgi:CheY-like chemotaxis protein